MQIRCPYCNEVVELAPWCSSCGCKLIDKVSTEDGIYNEEKKTRNYYSYTQTTSAVPKNKNMLLIITIIILFIIVIGLSMYTIVNRSEVKSINRELQKCIQENKELNQEISQLMDGPASKMEAIDQAYANKEWQLVIELVDSFEKEFPDSSLLISGQVLRNNAKNILSIDDSEKIIINPSAEQIISDYHLQESVLEFVGKIERLEIESDPFWALLNLDSTNKYVILEWDNSEFNDLIVVNNSLSIIGSYKKCLEYVKPDGKIEQVAVIRILKIE